MTSTTTNARWPVGGLVWAQFGEEWWPGVIPPPEFCTQDDVVNLNEGGGGGSSDSNDKKGITNPLCPKKIWQIPRDAGHSISIVFLEDFTRGNYDVASVGGADNGLDDEKQPFLTPELRVFSFMDGMGEANPGAAASIAVGKDLVQKTFAYEAQQRQRRPMAAATMQTCSQLGTSKDVDHSGCWAVVSAEVLQKMIKQHAAAAAAAVNGSGAPVAPDGPTPERQIKNQEAVDEEGDEEQKDFTPQNVAKEQVALERKEQELEQKKEDIRAEEEIRHAAMATTTSNTNSSSDKKNKKAHEEEDLSPPKLLLPHFIPILDASGQNVTLQHTTKQLIPSTTAASSTHGDNLQQQQQWPSRASLVMDMMDTKLLTVVKNRRLLRYFTREDGKVIKEVLAECQPKKKKKVGGGGGGGTTTNNNNYESAQHVDSDNNLQDELPLFAAQFEEDDEDDIAGQFTDFIEKHNMGNGGELTQSEIAALEEKRSAAIRARIPENMLGNYSAAVGYFEEGLLSTCNITMRTTANGLPPVLPQSAAQLTDEVHAIGVSLAGAGYTPTLIPLLLHEDPVVRRWAKTQTDRTMAAHFKSSAAGVVVPKSTATPPAAAATTGNASGAASSSNNAISGLPKPVLDFHGAALPLPLEILQEGTTLIEGFLTVIATHCPLLEGSPAAAFFLQNSVKNGAFAALPTDPAANVLAVSGKNNDWSAQESSADSLLPQQQAHHTHPSDAEQQQQQQQRLSKIERVRKEWLRKYFTCSVDVPTAATSPNNGDNSTSYGMHSSSASSGLASQYEQQGLQRYLDGFKGLMTTLGYFRKRLDRSVTAAEKQNNAAAGEILQRERQHVVALASKMIQIGFILFGAVDDVNKKALEQHHQQHGGASDGAAAAVPPPQLPFGTQCSAKDLDPFVVFDEYFMTLDDLLQNHRDGKAAAAKKAGHNALNLKTTTSGGATTTPVVVQNNNSGTIWAYNVFRYVAVSLATKAMTFHLQHFSPSCAASSSPPTSHGASPLLIPPPFAASCCNGGGGGGGDGSFTVSYGHSNSLMMGMGGPMGSDNGSTDTNQVLLQPHQLWRELELTMKRTTKFFTPILLLDPTLGQVGNGTKLQHARKKRPETFGIVVFIATKLLPSRCTNAQKLMSAAVKGSQKVQETGGLNGDSTAVSESKQLWQQAAKAILETFLNLITCSSILAHRDAAVFHAALLCEEGGRGGAVNAIMQFLHAVMSHQFSLGTALHQIVSSSGGGGGGAPAAVVNLAHLCSLTVNLFAQLDMQLFPLSPQPRFAGGAMAPSSIIAGGNGGSASSSSTSADLPNAPLAKMWSLGTKWLDDYSRLAEKSLTSFAKQYTQHQRAATGGQQQQKQHGLPVQLIDAPALVRNNSNSATAKTSKALGTSLVNTVAPQLLQIMQLCYPMMLTLLKSTPLHPQQLQQQSTSGVSSGGGGLQASKVGSVLGVAFRDDTFPQFPWDPVHKHSGLSNNDAAAAALHCGGPDSPALKTLWTSLVQRLADVANGIVKALGGAAAPNSGTSAAPPSSSSAGNNHPGLAKAVNNVLLIDLLLERHRKQTTKNLSPTTVAAAAQTSAFAHHTTTADQQQQTSIWNSETCFTTNQFCFLLNIIATAQDETLERVGKRWIQAVSTLNALIEPLVEDGIVMSMFNSVAAADGQQGNNDNDAELSGPSPAPVPPTGTLQHQLSCCTPASAAGLWYLENVCAKGQPDVLDILKSPQLDNIPPIETKGRGSTNSPYLLKVFMAASVYQLVERQFGKWVAALEWVLRVDEPSPATAITTAAVVALPTHQQQQAVSKMVQQSLRRDDCLLLCRMMTLMTRVVNKTLPQDVRRAFLVTITKLPGVVNAGSASQLLVPQQRAQLAQSVSAPEVLFHMLLSKLETLPHTRVYFRALINITRSCRNFQAVYLEEHARQEQEGAKKANVLVGGDGDEDGAFMPPQGSAADKLPMAWREAVELLSKAVLAATDEEVKELVSSADKSCGSGGGSASSAQTVTSAPTAWFAVMMLPQALTKAKQVKRTKELERANKKADLDDKYKKYEQQEQMQRQRELDQKAENDAFGLIQKQRRYEEQQKGSILAAAAASASAATGSSGSLPSGMQAPAAPVNLAVKKRPLPPPVTSLAGQAHPAPAPVPLPKNNNNNAKQSATIFVVDDDTPNTSSVASFHPSPHQPNAAVAGKIPVPPKPTITLKSAPKTPVVVQQAPMPAPVQASSLTSTSSIAAPRSFVVPSDARPPQATGVKRNAPGGNDDGVEIVGIKPAPPPMKQSDEQHPPKAKEPVGLPANAVISNDLTFSVGGGGGGKGISFVGQSQQQQQQPAAKFFNGNVIAPSSSAGGPSNPTRQQQLEAYQKHRQAEMEKELAKRRVEEDQRRVQQHDNESKEKYQRMIVSVAIQTISAKRSAAAAKSKDGGGNNASDPSLDDIFPKAQQQQPPQGQRNVTVMSSSIWPKNPPRNIPVTFTGPNASSTYRDCYFPLMLMELRYDISRNVDELIQQIVSSNNNGGGGGGNASAAASNVYQVTRMGGESRPVADYVSSISQPHHVISIQFRSTVDFGAGGGVVPSVGRQHPGQYNSSGGGGQQNIANVFSETDLLLFMCPKASPSAHDQQQQQATGNKLLSQQEPILAYVSECNFQMRCCKIVVDAKSATYLNKAWNSGVSASGAAGSGSAIACHRMSSLNQYHQSARALVDIAQNPATNYFWNALSNPVSVRDESENIIRRSGSADAFSSQQAIAATLSQQPLGGGGALAGASPAARMPKAGGGSLLAEIQNELAGGGGRPPAAGRLATLAGRVNNPRTRGTSGGGGHHNEWQHMAVNAACEGFLPKVEENKAADNYLNLQKSPFVLVEGPPGTGKTHTITGIVTEVMHRATKHKRDANGLKTRQKILICAPSNTAVDEVVLRLRRLGIPDINSATGRMVPLKVVRVGVRDRVDSAVIDSGLFFDDQVEKLMRQGTLGGARVVAGQVVGGGQQQPQNEGSKRTAAREAVLEAAQVVCTTLGSIRSFFSNTEFDFVIMDEASQATEPQCILPLMFGCKRLVLVGDVAQLRATILCPQASRSGYGRSLMERLLFHGHARVTLREQYRMPPPISAFPNQEFYKGVLIDAEKFNDPDAQGVLDFTSSGGGRDVLLPPAIPRLGFIDVQGSVELTSAASKSTCNPIEAQILVAAMDKIRTSLFMDLDEFSSRCGVITFYDEQRKELERIIANRYGYNNNANGGSGRGGRGQQNPTKFHIGTVDGFQGKEKDFIFISCVRSKNKAAMTAGVKRLLHKPPQTHQQQYHYTEENIGASATSHPDAIRPISATNTTIGFLSDRNRLNVALTRARNMCFVVGDAVLLSTASTTRNPNHHQPPGQQPQQEPTEPDAWSRLTAHFAASSIEANGAGMFAVALPDAPGYNKGVPSDGADPNNKQGPVLITCDVADMLVDMSLPFEA